MSQPAEPPLISVVIVNYNGGDYLLDTVNSALASSIPIELFVVDNGSVDGSIQALRRKVGQEPRLRIMENGVNLGFAKANNVALERARGEFLLLLNPDCFVEPDTLARMVDAVREDPAVGMAGCLIRNPDGSEQVGCRRTIPTPWSGLVRVLHLGPLIRGRQPARLMDLTHKPLPDHPVYAEAISGAFMLVRRQALEQVGLMDDDYFLHCEDLDWCQSFQNAGWKILFVPGVEIVHHKGACSVKRPVFVLWHKHRGMARFYRKFLSQRYSMPLNWLVLVGIWSRFSLMLPMTALGRVFSDKPAAARINPSDAAAEPPALPRLAALRGRPVLVTGGTGFIGHHLVEELLRQGARVRVLSRMPPDPDSAWSKSGVEWIQGDLQDAASLQPACGGIHTLFHLAGCAHQLDALDSSGLNHQDVTEKGTQRLLQTAVQAGLKNVVFVSSVKAMGEESELCLNEETPCKPESSYGIAKLHAERAVLQAAADSGMQASVLRLPLVYGPGNKGNLPRMINAIREGRFPPLPRVNNRRSMVHVEDVVQALVLCATHEAANGRTYIITDGRSYSTWEIYQAISSSLGRHPPKWSVPLTWMRLGAKLGDGLTRLHIPVSLNSATLRKLLGSAWYDDGRIRAELGYLPRYDLHQALGEMVREEAGKTKDHQEPVAEAVYDPVNPGIPRG